MKSVLSSYTAKHVKVKVAQSCPALCDTVDCIVHGILQARILEWVAYPFSSGSSPPRNRTGVSCIAGGFFTNWVIRETRKTHILFFFNCNAVNPCYSQTVYLWFAYSLKFTCNPQSNTQVLSWSFSSLQGCDTFESTKFTLPPEVKWGNLLPSCFSSYCKQVSTLCFV